MTSHARVPADHILCLTHALLIRDTALPAIAELKDIDDPSAIDGLIEVLYRSPTAEIGIAAIGALENRHDGQVESAVIDALSQRQPTLRLAAIKDLQRRKSHKARDGLLRVLRGDWSWMVRRAAVDVLADLDLLSMLDAATDPHWRVRHALARHCESMEPTLRESVCDNLRASAENTRAAGLLRYLQYRWNQRLPLPAARAPETNPLTKLAGWDWDPAVLARNIEAWTAETCAANSWSLPGLLGLDDSRLRRLALAPLRRLAATRERGDAASLELLREAAAWIQEPRHPAALSARELLESLDVDTRDEILANPPIRVAYQAAVEYQQAAAVLKPPADRRAEALTADQAQRLMEDPTRESSWHVLRRAVRLAKVPQWSIEPDPPWSPPVGTEIPATTEGPSPAAQQAPAPRHILPEATSPAARTPEAASTGAHWLQKLSRIGISGHYGLPTKDFFRCLDAGINLMFWEPNYQTMTNFYRQIPPSQRRQIYLIAGTFEADGNRIEQDVQRVLRALRIECIDIFLLFWVRSWARINDDVLETLQRLEQQGTIRRRGLSTHSRPLAMEALRDGWDPLMVRHSAAHRGAEQSIFPAAAKQPATLITFNNTCYGRLLSPIGRSPAADAGDRYRYSLSQPGVAACLSAPADAGQLDENLAALARPELSAERRLHLLQHGEVVYREDSVFRDQVRGL